LTKAFMSELSTPAVYDKTSSSWANLETLWR
jgi:hypothetical protein